VFYRVFTSALREMRSVLTNQRALVAMAGAGLLLGLSGPFQTGDVLGLGQRLLYWVAVAVSTFTVGSGIQAGTSTLIGSRLPRFVRLAVISVAVGLGVFALVSGLNAVVFSIPILDGPVGSRVLTFIAIAAVIVVGLDLATATSPEAAPSPPPLLDRLRYELRGDLVWLSVQDHYVQIVTTKGRDMVLMRLSDAIREVGETPGLQVHRSHWVALGHISAVKRQGDRALLTLSGGDHVPVSRGYLPQIGKAGLLPKSGVGGT